MATHQHTYDLTVTWTGNQGPGTSSYAAYARDHEVTAPGLPPIAGSADPAFRGDPSRWNPEQLLVASLAQCHMLWYLHLAARAGVTVVAYEDHPHGVMTTEADGSGQFERVTLRPRVTISQGSDAEVAHRLHADVPALCFIARSVSFPVDHEPAIPIEQSAEPRSGA
ncbi:OsmC family protein [Arsenicicoccus sp. oral taxon 190]|uniref:OsmC family protein n=1 Tax=Arsenicicoccus sp. oral taxon 190 TaxID=1658671 RepID=UPI00067A237D|nr:OsmC family protein [Arsenicicoccus sp. oral taxon 190]AKT50586.1 peroxiredoxin [Arsenicicoccus sp. oral taxon 190]